MTERICEKLDVKYTGFSSFINLRFSENGARGRTLTIRMIHGWGAGARTRGAALTKYSRDIGLWLADVYYYAHDHLLQQDRIQQQKPCGKTIVARPKWVILGGTYLKSYSSTTHAPYSEHASVELGSPVLHVKPNNKWLEVWTDLGHATVIE